MRSTLAFVFTLIVASSAPAQREFGFDNTRASGQPYLKPEETVAKFTVPPEFEVKLFAGEPSEVSGGQLSTGAHGPQSGRVEVQPGQLGHERYARWRTSITLLSAQVSIQ